MHPLIETWQISSRINEYLLSSLAEEHLADLSPSKGRTVAAQFAHIHNVRLMWLRAAAPELEAGLVKLEKDQPLGKKTLQKALQQSAEAISRLLEKGFETGKIKGFKPHPEAFVGYLIAHEAHHRGQLIISLKENGHLPDKKILFGLWEWGSR